MSSDYRQPFVDSRAFDKANSTHVQFPSQADAMLASLQLFHDVPCRIMDLIFTVVTHPDFDAKQLTLRNSGDVVDIVEENRLKDRMAVVHGRSLSSDGHMEQAGFPEFVLHEILDIIHTERMDAIREHFEKTLDDDSAEEFKLYFHSFEIRAGDTLKAISCVHRSWTTPAQKALGRVFHICRPTDRMGILRDPVQKSIFGPWTSVVAMQIYPRIEFDDSYYEPYFSNDLRMDYHQWFESLHRTLVGFINLKTVLISSCSRFFNEWYNSTTRDLVRRNACLKEVALCQNEAFILDTLIENTRISGHLRTLDIGGAQFSDVAQEKAMQGPGFACLSHLTIRPFFPTLEEDFMILSIVLSNRCIPRLKSLRIIDAKSRFFEEYLERSLTPSQCATIFKQLCTLHIHGKHSVYKWLKWIMPYCSSVESLTIIDGDEKRQFFETNVGGASTVTPPHSTTIFERLCTLHIDSKAAADIWARWISPYCRSLKTFTLETSMFLSPDFLSLIPASIQNLNLRLMTTSMTTDSVGINLEKVSCWLRCLLMISSFGHFSELKSFTLFLSRDVLAFLHYSECYTEEERVRTEIQTFKAEMNTVCECAGVKCCLDINDQ